MHYQTAVECYVELLQNGRFKEEAIELLRSEVRSSHALHEGEREELLNALATICETHSFGDSAPVERIRAVFMQHEGFQKEWAAVLASVLAGTRE